VKRWLLLWALLAVACSSSGAWRRVDTPHFVLRTDLSSSEAKRAGLALETTRDALVSAAWPRVNFSGEKTHVYVLANGLDFERHFGPRTAGIFSHQSPPVFILYGSADRWELRRTAHRPTPSVLRHEMAHQLSAEVWPHQPRWFSEGLAEFLEPVFYAEDNENVVIGGVNFEALGAYRNVRTLKVEDALKWKEGLGTLAEREAAGLYGLSWLFVHWLYHQHPQELGRYVDELHRGKSYDEAFAVAMSSIDLANIDRELHAYQKFGKFDEIPRPIVATPVTESSLEERLLSKGEIKDVQELLAAMGKSHSRPVHGSESKDDAPPRWEPAATPRVIPAFDYNSLPTLPQYPCEEEVAGAPPKKSSPTVAVGSRSSGPQRSNSVGARGASQASSQWPKPSGRLAPEIIQKVIRASYPKFRACYEEGLKMTENLGGRVTVRFDVEADGTVIRYEPVCTSLPDPRVVSCIAQHFTGLKFPKPTGGSVRVVYPIMLTPSD
jgi:hypothetical protein